MSIPLQGAMFCLDCDSVTEAVVVRTLDGKGGRRVASACERCGGRAVWPLARWIEPMVTGVDLARGEDWTVLRTAGPRSEIRELERMLSQDQPQKGTRP